MLVYIDWAQLSILLPEDGDKIQCPKRCLNNNKKKKNRTMGNVQKLNNCTFNSLGYIDEYIMQFYSAFDISGDKWMKFSIKVLTYNDIIAV
jgi:hypothetical protein